MMEHGRTNDKPPDDDDTNDGNSRSLTGKSLTEGGNDHDHQLNAICTGRVKNDDGRMIERGLLTHALTAKDICEPTKYDLAE